MRKKKKKKLNVKFFVTVFVLAVSLAVLFLTPLFDIQNIDISGQGRITRAEILIASGIRTNKNIFAINKSAAESKIKALGYIENVKITRKLPDTVKIQVKEGTVSSYLECGDVYAGVNKKGQTLCHISKASIPAGAPIVFGIGVAEAKVGKNIVLDEGRDDEYAVLLKMMDTFDAYSLTENITMIDISSKNNIVFRYRDALKVEFGDTKDYELKFNYIAAMISELGDNAAGVINMQSENYVYRNTIK